MVRESETCFSKLHTKKKCLALFHVALPPLCVTGGLGVGVGWAKHGVDGVGDGGGGV